MPTEGSKMTDHPMPAIRAKPFYLVTGATTCWKCAQQTKVSSLVLDEYEEPALDDEWDAVSGRTLLSYITAMNEGALAEVQSIAPWMRMGRSETADQVYLANHCTTCEALQGDWFLAKPGEVFFPLDKADMQAFAVTRFDRQLAIDAQCSWSGWHQWLELPATPK